MTGNLGEAVPNELDTVIATARLTVRIEPAVTCAAVEKLCSRYLKAHVVRMDHEMIVNRRDARCVADGAEDGVCFIPRVDCSAKTYFASLKLHRDTVRLAFGAYVQYIFDQIFELLRIGWSDDGDPVSDAAHAHQVVYSSLSVESVAVILDVAFERHPSVCNGGVYSVGRDENIPIERVTDRFRDFSIRAWRIPTNVHFYFVGDIENSGTLCAASLAASF